MPYCGRTGKEGDSEPPAKRPRLLANSQPLVRRKCSLIVGGNQREGKNKVDYSISSFGKDWLFVQGYVKNHRLFFVCITETPEGPAICTSGAPAHSNQNRTSTYD